MHKHPASMTKGAAALVAVAFGLLPVAPYAHGLNFPRAGVEGIPNGVAAPFAGRWWIGFPEGEGMINGVPVVDCDAPVTLAPASENVLEYHSPTGVVVPFELMEFSGRTTWLPEWGETTIAVWIDTDTFFAYSVDLTTGKARWDDPQVYRRCVG